MSQASSRADSGQATLTGITRVHLIHWARQMSKSLLGTRSADMGNRNHFTVKEEALTNRARSTRRPRRWDTPGENQAAVTGVILKFIGTKREIGGHSRVS